MMGFVLAAALFTAGSSTPAEARGQPQMQSASGLDAGAAEAAAAVDAFHAALRRGDPEAAATLMADDALIFESGEVERTRADYVAHHLSADAAFERTTTSTVTNRAGGSTGSLAWLATEGRVTGSYKGKTIDRMTTETMLLRRTDDGWKITHVHWSSGAAK